MDIQQVFTEIERKHKPYTYAEPPMSQPFYSVVKKRILNGTAKVETIRKFLKRFGYEIKITVNEKV